MAGGQHYAPTALPPGKTRCPLYWRLGEFQSRPRRLCKISPQLGFDPRTVQPAESRYTICAISAQVPKIIQYFMRVYSGSHTEYRDRYGTITFILILINRL